MIWDSNKVIIIIIIIIIIAITFIKYSSIVDFIRLVYVDIKKVINNFMPMYKLQKFAF